MNIEEFRQYCLSFNPVTIEFPFENNILVFKVMGKIFALCNVNESKNFNMKCESSEALQLHEEYRDMGLPGYHMNKKHFPIGDTVKMDNQIQDDHIRNWITALYQLAVKMLPKIDQEAFNILDSSIR